MATKLEILNENTHKYETLALVEENIQTSSPTEELTDEDIDEINLLLDTKERFNISNEAYHELKMIGKHLTRSWKIQDRVKEMNRNVLLSRDIWYPKKRRLQDGLSQSTQFQQSVSREEEKRRLVHTNLNRIKIQTQEQRKDKKNSLKLKEEKRKYESKHERVSNDCKKNVEKKIEKTEAKMKAHVWVRPPSKTGWQKPEPYKKRWKSFHKQQRKSGNFLSNCFKPTHEESFGKEVEEMTSLRALAADISESMENIKTSQSKDDKAAYSAFKGLTFGQNVSKCNARKSLSKLVNVGRTSVSSGIRERAKILSGEGESDSSAYLLQ